MIYWPYMPTGHFLSGPSSGPSARHLLVRPLPDACVHSTTLDQLSATHLNYWNRKSELSRVILDSRLSRVARSPVFYGRSRISDHFFCLRSREEQISRILLVGLSRHSDDTVTRENFRVKLLGPIWPIYKDLVYSVSSQKIQWGWASAIWQLDSHFDTVRIVCGAGSIKRSGVRPSVSLSHHSNAAATCGGFAAELHTRKRYRSTAPLTFCICMGLKVKLKRFIAE